MDPVSPVRHSGVRVRLAVAVAIVALCIPVVVVLVRGEELLHHPEPIFWSIWVPALVVLLALLFALSRSAAYLAAIALLALVAVEFGFAFAPRTRPWVETTRVAGPGIKTWKSIAPYGPRPGGFATVRRLADGEFESEVSVHLDEHGRRVTPFPHDGRPEQAALFFGGSWVFGTGIEDGETLASAFSRANPRYRPYNYAFDGWGPSQVLDILRGRDLRAEIPEEVGLAVYVLTKPDPDRVVGTLRVISRYCRRCSNYELDASGAVVRRGDLSTGRPLRTVLFALLERSNILEYLRVDLPPRRTEEDRRRLVAVIRTVRDELMELFPASDFVLVLMAGTPNDPFTASLYAEAGLHVLDYRGLIDPQDPRMRATPTDNHPSALANERIARQLVADLAAGTGSE